MNVILACTRLIYMNLTIQFKNTIRLPEKTAEDA